MIILATILSGLSLLMSVLLLIRLKVTIPGLILWFPKLAAGALSPLWAIMGAAGAIIGWVYGALWVIPMGIIGAGIMIWYVWRCTRDHNGFEHAFGSSWEDQIPPQQANHILKRRWSPYLKMKASQEPSWERDIPFWTVPGTDRQLHCDLWQPGDGKNSGLAFIYYHGSGWHIGDKDYATRPFFQHLVAQGHTVMDVAYRLTPEVDIYGMIGDVKRSIAWMKVNAPRFGVNPEKIVLGGGSAGGHLAILAAYSPKHPELTPEDIKDADLSVSGVVSYYGPTDLLAFYQNTDQQRAKQPGAGYFPTLSTDPDAPKDLRNAGRLDILLGGHPEQVPDMYQLASTTTHVHPGCPPTLLIQGGHDRSVPVNATCAFFTQLVEAGVPAINVVLPLTAHGFDLLVPQISPPAQSALYDVDRFLAILLYKGKIK